MQFGKLKSSLFVGCMYCFFLLVHSMCESLTVNKLCYQLYTFFTTGTLPDEESAGSSGLEANGFPPIGTYLQEGDPFYWLVEEYKHPHAYKRLSL